MSKKRQLAAIVFTDISNFTSMMDKDESKALNIRHKQRDNIQAALTEFDGEYIKEIGDGDLMMFNSATDAVNFTLKLHNDINPEDDFSIRAAVHIGDVVKEGEDIFGAGVNIASRIHTFATPGCTVISDSVFKEIKNKSKFTINSIGEKNVKGIDEPIYMYQVSLAKDSTAKQTQEDVRYVEKSLMSDLFERRVPQFIGLYLAISWGVIQFITWIADRYLLSPHLVDLSLGIAISMLPSILILSYFHGRPGKDKWNRIEKIVVPANFLIATFTLFLFFYPKNLGAVTKDITIEDLSGNEITKTIIKPEFRQSFTTFLFNNLESDTTYNWLSKGIGSALTTDLLQMTFCSTRNYRSRTIKRNMGFKKTEQISLGDKQKIANRALSKYFITGTYSVSNDMYTLNVELYKSKNANLVSSNQFTGNNFFSLIDDATRQIKLDMEIPSSYLETTTDLPIKDKLTNSVDALKYYTYHLNTAIFDQEIEMLNKAIEFDPNFAAAHMDLSIKYAGFNMELWKKHSDLALKYASRLQDGYTFLLRIIEINHGDPPDIEHRDKLADMWIELHPEDTIPLELKAAWAQFQNDIETCIFYTKKRLEINPDDYAVILDLAIIYAQINNDYENGLKYFNKYIELNPKNPEGYQNIAEYIYLPQLDYKNALEYLLKAQTLGAGGTDFDIKLITIRSKINNWSTDQYVDKMYALNEDLDPHDINACAPMSSINQNIIKYLTTRGQFRKSLPYQEESTELAIRTQGPMGALMGNVQTGAIYMQLGEYDKGYAQMHELETLLSEPPNNYMVPFVQCCFYTEAKEWDKFTSLIDEAMDKIAAIGMGPVLEPAFNSFQAKYFEDTGNYQAAIGYLESSINAPSSLGGEAQKAGPYISLGRIYQILKQYDKSQEMFENAQVLVDDSARLFYEYSILKEKQGNKKEALELILKAYDLYKDGDKELELTQKIFERYESFQEQLP